MIEPTEAEILDVAARIDRFLTHVTSQLRPLGDCSAEHIEQEPEDEAT